MTILNNLILYLIFLNLRSNNTLTIHGSINSKDDNHRDMMHKISANNQVSNSKLQMLCGLLDTRFFSTFCKNEWEYEIEYEICH